jgi:hypothetical protein
MITSISPTNSGYFLHEFALVDVVNMMEGCIISILYSDAFFLNKKLVLNPIIFFNWIYFICCLSILFFNILIFYRIKFVKFSCLSIIVFPVAKIIFNFCEFTFNFWMQYIIYIFAYCNFVWIG